MSIYPLKDIYNCTKTLRVSPRKVLTKFNFEKNIKTVKAYKKYTKNNDLVLYKICPIIDSLEIYSKKEKSYVTISLGNEKYSCWRYDYKRGYEKSSNEESSFLRLSGKRTKYIHVRYFWLQLYR